MVSATGTPLFPCIPIPYISNRLCSVGLEVHDVNGSERLMLSAAVGNSIGPLRTRRGAAGKREWVSPEMIGVMYRDAVTTPPPYKGRAKLEKNMVVTVEPGM